MADRERTNGKLAVVLGQFPSSSETFVLRELLQLRKLGFPILIMSLSPPEDDAAPADADKLINNTIYRDPPMSGPSLLAQLWAMIYHPVGYASAVALLIANAVQNPAAFRRLVVGLLAAACFAKKAHPQITEHIHAHFGSMPATAGLFLAEIFGTTFSMSLHARDIFTDEAILLRKKLAEAEFSAVCNEHGLKRLQREFRLISQQRLHLIHHGVDPARYVKVRKPPSDPRKLLAVGRLVEKKGFDILLKAAAVARQNGAEFVLDIVGDGPQKEELQRLCHGLALHDITTFHGTIPHEKLIPMYRKAYAVALASIVVENGDRDGIPNVLIEALAMGIPVVSTTTGGIPELIIHENTGLLAKPGDPESLAAAIERILYDEQLRAKVSEAGRAKVLEEFDIARNVRKLAELLADYIEPRR